jgi:isoamylase
VGRRICSISADASHGLRLILLQPHDGFTLNDLVSFNEKHNEANEEGNRDGHSHNLSSNYGVEGPTNDPSIVQTRSRQMRNVLTTLLLSRGSSMLLAGDEFSRSQRGNNNAYCQDNEISWVDWEGIRPEGWALARFTQRLIALRRALPMLRGGRFLTGEQDEELGVKDVTWLLPSAEEMAPGHWSDRSARAIGVLLDGRAQKSGIRTPGTDATLLLLLNAYQGEVAFTLPAAPGGREWVCLLDTNRSDLTNMPRFKFGHVYTVVGRSLLLFMLRPEMGVRAGGEADRSFEYVVNILQDLEGRAAIDGALEAGSGQMALLGSAPYRVFGAGLPPDTR